MRADRVELRKCLACGEVKAAWQFPANKQVCLTCNPAKHIQSRVKEDRLKVSKEVMDMLDAITFGIARYHA